MDKPLSFSTMKTFSQCEERGLATYNGTFRMTENNAIKLGKYVDSAMQGEIQLQSYKDCHPELFKKNGELLASYAEAQEAVNRINGNAWFHSYLEGEKQKELHGIIGGAEFVGFADFMTDTRIVDLKYFASVKRVGTDDLLTAYKYTWQGAIYRELARQMDGKVRDVFFAIATREKPAGLYIVHMAPDVLDDALTEVCMRVPHVMAVIDGEVAPTRCYACEYCRMYPKEEVIDSLLLGMHGDEMEEIS